jgi:hypothetical protein
VQLIPDKTLAGILTKHERIIVTALFYKEGRNVGNGPPI